MGRVVVLVFKLGILGKIQRMTLGSQGAKPDQVKAKRYLRRDDARHDGPWPGTRCRLRTGQAYINSPALPAASLGRVNRHPMPGDIHAPRDPDITLCCHVIQ
jgi:hypothetical protein